MDLAKYRSLFLSESREYIHSMSDAILQLRKHPTPELYDHLFRLAHSIKGLAASMTYTPLRDVSHRMEDIFDRLKKSPDPPGEAAMSVLFSGIALIEAMLGEIDRSGSSVSDPEPFLASAQALVSAQPEVPANPKPGLELIIPQRADAAAETAESRLFFKVELKVAEDASLPAARALVAVKRIEELGKMSRLSPPIEEIRGGSFAGSLICYLVTPHSVPEVQESLSELSDIQKVTVTPVDPGSRQAPAPDAGAAGEERLRESLRMHSVRIDTHLVDRVVEGLGELMILNAQLQDTMPENAEVTRLQMLIQRIYDQALDLRMLPFKSLSAHFPRIVHDLGQKLQKKVEFNVEGAELHMDKSILDELADPLIHLMRNAIDHGIEAPSLRTKMGKPESGRLLLSVSKQGDRVLIRMEDDGKGLDPNFIRKTAVRKGVISEKAASILNQHEVLMLLTRPGFSTTDQVSDISGRGVGLDVVREKIEALGGAFRMASAPGHYTRFDLIVPFTVAVIPALLVRSGTSRLAAPMTRIDRFLQIRRKDVHYTQGRPVIFYDNSTYYLERLESLLHRTAMPEFAETFPAFVTEHQNRRIAWVVDELISERQILLRSLGPPLDQLACYSGATVLGKGEVVPVVDLEYLYRERYQSS